MSDMMFREPNQVKWMGSRPGHNGTQVLVDGTFLLLVPTVFYTVPVGQTLHITNMLLSRGQFVATFAYIAIYDDVPALSSIIFPVLWAIAPQGNPIINSYWPPIEVPAGYHLYISQTVNCQLVYVVHGWVE